MRSADPLALLAAAVGAATEVWYVLAAHPPTRFMTSVLGSISIVTAVAAVAPWRGVRIPLLASIAVICTTLTLLAGSFLSFVFLFIAAMSWIALMHTLRGRHSFDNESS